MSPSTYTQRPARPVCRFHGAGAPQVKEAARNRLAMAVDPLMAQLLKIAASAESEAVRLAATKDALDRAGFGAAHLVKLAVAQPWEDLLGEIVDDDLFDDVHTGERRSQGRGRITDAPFPGGVSEREDTTDEDNRTAAQYDPHEDDSRTTYNIKPTVRSKVIYPESTPEQRASAAQTAQRVRTLIFDTDEPDDRRSEYGRQRSANPPTDPNRPPQYVREAMEADGEDWRAGEGGGSRRADFGS